MDKYVLSKEAREDLIRIYNYGAGVFGESQAEKYYRAFFEQFDKIAKSPYSYQAVHFLNNSYRRCPCGSDTIYYEIMEHHIEIVTIIGSQDFQNFE